MQIGGHVGSSFRYYMRQINTSGAKTLFGITLCGKNIIYKTTVFLHMNQFLRYTFGFVDFGPIWPCKRVKQRGQQSYTPMQRDHIELQTITFYYKTVFNFAREYKKMCFKTFKTTRPHYWLLEIVSINCHIKDVWLYKHMAFTSTCHRITHLHVIKVM